MIVVTMFVLAVTGAIVLAMRMDEDPSRWAGETTRGKGRRARSGEAAAGAPGVAAATVEPLNAE